MKVNVDLTDLAPHEIQTSGGECLYQELGKYVLHFGDISITLNPESALQLVRVLGEHLKDNYHGINL